MHGCLQPFEDSSQTLPEATIILINRGWFQFETEITISMRLSRAQRGHRGSIKSSDSPVVNGRIKGAGK